MSCSPSVSRRRGRAARRVGTPALAALAVTAALPSALRAQPGVGPCAGTAPSRSALAPLSARPRDGARQLIELRASRGGDNVRFVRAGAGYLGVSTLEVSDMRLTTAGRVVRYCTYPVVVSVVAGSPADRGGLEQGDTLVAYNARDLVTSGEIELDAILVPGETVRVALRRDGRALTRPVVVGRRETEIAGMVRRWNDQQDGPLIIVDGVPRGVAGGVAPTPRAASQVYVSTPRAPRAPVAPGGVPDPAQPPLPFPPPAIQVMPPGFSFAFGGGPMIVAGAQVITLDEDMREALDARAGAGVVVIRIADGSPAADAGLRTGDIIRAVNGSAVASPALLQRALARARMTPSAGGAEQVDDERLLRLDVERKGKRKTVTLR